MTNLLRIHLLRIPLLFLAIGTTACTGTDGEAPQLEQVGVETAAPVVPGAAVLLRNNFRELNGLRVGAVVNHTARVGDQHLIDAMQQAGVTVSRIFSPEHGFRGNADAGAKVDNSIDAATGVPIFSLYGSNRAPTPESLEDVDVLLFDIQDVGARFYTYISTLGLSMQAAATQGIPFWVLDRPNPLGGEYVSGFVLEPENQSYVGMYPIPIAHGLTVGEIAKMIVGEEWLPGLEGLDLMVVPVEGWNRAMRWPDTQLEWIAPSPNLPGADMAILYAGTCLIEATSASEGRGTMTPFKLIGAPWVDGEQLAKELSAADFGGVTISAVQFTPKAIEGMSSSPKHKDVAVSGVQIDVTNADEVDPMVVGIGLITALARQADESRQTDFLRESGLRRLAGTDRLMTMLRDGKSAEEIVASWKPEVDAFRELRKQYLIYR